jgi:ABC-type multidrug transport system ATPase subunit
VVAERQALYEEMTAQQYLELFAELFGVRRPGARIRSLLAHLELDECSRQRAGEFSQGMRQKLGLARALLHDPELLILDEPTNGLDPRAVKQVRDLIQAENQRGRTVLLSSHLLSEVEISAHRVGVIRHGRLLVEEETQALKRKLTDKQALEVEVDEAPATLEQVLSEQPWVDTVRRSGQKLVVELRGQEDHRHRVSQLITASGGVIIGMRLLEASLEDAYLTITEANVARLTGD